MEESQEGQRRAAGVVRLTPQPPPFSSGAGQCWLSRRQPPPKNREVCSSAQFCSVSWSACGLAFSEQGGLATAGSRWEAGVCHPDRVASVSAGLYWVPTRPASWRSCWAMVIGASGAAQTAASQRHKRHGDMARQRAEGSPKTREGEPQRSKRSRPLGLKSSSGERPGCHAGGIGTGSRPSAPVDGITISNRSIKSLMRRPRLWGRSQSGRRGRSRAVTYRSQCPAEEKGKAKEKKRSGSSGQWRPTA